MYPIDGSRRSKTAESQQCPTLIEDVARKSVAQSNPFGTVGVVVGEKQQDGVAACRRSLGDYLREQRCRVGMSLESIADETKVVRRTLEQIEAGDWSGLPATVFIRGFVRAYARCVDSSG